ncbi:unnamed protein product [Owenia fusiformis]|uniref:Uncharacterized protein n=1 Tax=Owenia fusiformis TaxID=6347 RepID=A0A8J1U5G8_OWEFU|nr:unnamed protein product [Owenia fusiformis]
MADRKTPKFNRDKTAFENMSDIWKSKAKTYFVRFDANSDGIHERKDYEAIIERLINHMKTHGIEPTKQQIERFNHTFIDTVWCESVAGGHDTGYDRKITMEEFCNNIAEHMIPNIEFCTGVTLQFASHIFDAIDLNRDNVLSLKEYSAFLGMLDVDEEHAKIAFLSINKGTGDTISREEFCNAYSDFWMNFEEGGIGENVLGPIVRW